MKNYFKIKIRFFICVPFLLGTLSSKSQIFVQTFSYTGGACVSTSPYYFNTNYTGDVVEGNTYTLSVSREGNTYDTYFNVWVDWNNDAPFAAGEMVCCTPGVPGVIIVNIRSSPLRSGSRIGI